MSKIRATEQRFSWLHLSDLHAGRDGHAYLWPNVQEVVLDDLRTLHGRSGPWHAVFFTGDLSQSGRPEQFNLVAEFRDVLRSQLERLGSHPTFISTPGNHDVARPDPHSPLVAHAHLVPDDAERREHLFVADDDEFRNSLTDIFRAWLDWHQANEVPGLEEYRAGVLPGDYSATVTVGGRRIGVVALNTTALQLDATSAEKRVTVHAAQLAAVCPNGGGAWATGHDATFLLTHHPPEWLDARGYDALRTEIAPPGRFLLHLYGHQHEPRNCSFSFGGGMPRHEALGRSLFGLEHWGQANETRLHGYSVGEVQFPPAPRMRLWPRAAVVRHGGGWQLVADPGEATDDSGAIELNAAALQSQSPSASTSPGDALSTGWCEVTRARLDEAGDALSLELLKHYFDGGQPDWRHAQSDSIPRREVVADVVADLARAAEIKLPRVVLLVGPTGEGKSTALRQVVAEAIQSGGFRVLWRDDPETPLMPEELLALPAGPWIVATDDADSLRPTPTGAGNAFYATTGRTCSLFSLRVTRIGGGPVETTWLGKDGLTRGESEDSGLVRPLRLSVPGPRAEN